MTYLGDCSETSETPSGKSKSMTTQTILILALPFAALTALFILMGVGKAHKLLTRAKVTEPLPEVVEGIKPENEDPPIVKHWKIARTRFVNARIRNERKHMDQALKLKAERQLNIASEGLEKMDSAMVLAGYNPADYC